MSRRLRVPATWTNARGNQCAVCGLRPGPYRLHFHHVVHRQIVRRWAGDQWDPRNGMTVCEQCHSRHHTKVRPIPLRFVPDAALAFAVDLMGEDRAVAYFGRYYNDSGREAARRTQHAAT